MNKENELEYFDFKLEPGLNKIERISKYVGEIKLSIITYYDGQEHINQTYISLINQTFPHWEWIIIANEIDEVICNLEKQDSRIRIVKAEEKTKKCAIYNAAKLAKSEILFILSDMDVIDKTLVECGYFTMITNPEAVWAYSSRVNFGETNTLYNKRITISEIIEKHILARCVFIRKEKILEAGESKEVLDEPYEDFHMWLYFLSKKYIPVKMDFYGYWQRQVEKHTKMSKNTIIERTESVNSYIKDIKENVDLDEITIEYSNLYYIDYRDIPKKIEVSTKNIFENKKNKRILFIFPWSVVGGADLFNLNLINGLRLKGYEISVITTKKHDYELRQKVEQSVDEYFDLTTFLKEKDWAGFIYHIIKSRNINCVVISNSFYGYYALPWLKYHFKDIPFVDYIHAENWTLRNGGFPRDSNSVANYLDATYTCTKHLKNIMYDIMRRNIKNVKSIYIGTDIDYYDYNNQYEMEKELKEKYKDKKVILFIGRMVHYKRPLFAIKLMEEIKKERKDVKLAILGDGINMNDVKEYVKENKLDDCVDIYGMQEDVRPFYKIGDVTLICSLREGLTLTTYESLAMGLPVISSDIGGEKELIGDDCGALIKAYQIPDEQFDFNYSKEEIKEYKDAVYKILDNKEEIDYKKNCREKVIKKFSINRMINDMDKLITNLIESGSTIDKDICNNIEFAERYLLINGMVEVLREMNIENEKKKNIQE